VSIASAQSSVTLYGSIDAGYANVESQSSIGELNNSASGIGGNNMTTSRWGIKGTEELGGGLSAFFNLESQINPGSGATGSDLFDRKSIVGLAGNFGTVKLGRDYTTLYEVYSAGDIFATTGATTANLNPTGTRTDNMVSYETPVFGGFSAKFMVGENKAIEDGAPETKNKNSGLSAKYANGPLMVTAGWGENTGVTSDTGSASGLTPINTDVTDGASLGVSKTEGSAITATYDFTVAKLFTNYTQGEFTALAGGQALKAKETNIGVTVPMGAFTLMAAYGYNDISGSTVGGAVDADGHDYVLGAVYALSKRTSMYVKTGTYNKVNGTIGGVNADFKTTATAVGLRHSF